MTVHALYPADDGLGCCRGLIYVTLSAAWMLFLTVLILAAPVKVASDDFRPRKEFRMFQCDRSLKAHELKGVK